jgi:acetoin utilization deacetylase AcuC-like enzyme
MSKTGYLYNPLYLQHKTEPHPENPGRLVAIDHKIRSADFFDSLEIIEPRKATLEEIAFNHDTAYIADLDKSCQAGIHQLDADTSISRESYDAALLAAGAGLTAIDKILDGELDNAFCAVRPPGHHAEKNHSMGFCLFNNVAIAAHYARNTKDLNRVLIFDWDVHHGNGTQNSFYRDSTVFYSSTHQYPFYPGTGDANETGTGDGLGATLNFPMQAFADDKTYLDVVENRLIPAIVNFKPELIIISAGFDAHKNDPLANIQLSTDCFGQMTALIKQAANEVCEGRLLSMLEGGYDYEALSNSVHLHLQQLSA